MTSPLGKVRIRRELEFGFAWWHDVEEQIRRLLVISLSLLAIGTWTFTSESSPEGRIVYNGQRRLAMVFQTKDHRGCSRRFRFLEGFQFLPAGQQFMQVLPGGQDFAARRDLSA